MGKLVIRRPTSQGCGEDQWGDTHEIQFWPHCRHGWTKRTDPGPFCIPGHPAPAPSPEADGNEVFVTLVLLSCRDGKWRIQHKDGREREAQAGCEEQWGLLASNAAASLASFGYPPPSEASVWIPKSLPGTCCQNSFPPNVHQTHTQPSPPHAGSSTLPSSGHLVCGWGQLRRGGGGVPEPSVHLATHACLHST